MTRQATETICWLSELGADDVPRVGGKNASLGEMIRALEEEGIRVPEGFATTADAYRSFLEENGLDEAIASLLERRRVEGASLEETGKEIRRRFLQAEMPPAVADAIRDAYGELCERLGREVDVAVRSSATAEDLPEASFAGQQETFLNIRGADDLLDACGRCYASLFTDRAISYREEQGFDHRDVALSVGVQRMVRSDKAGSGVIFTLDTETGFPDVVFINAAWGLGENVVQGAVNPDAYLVYKPLLQREGITPIIRKERGAKEKKMVYARGGSSTTKNVETSRRERRSFVLDDEEILTLPVIVRVSDFKTNEYADLLGGRAFEPEEENPMLGFRGASRYYSERYRDGFALECAALKMVRQELGLDNVVVMIPFCRTPDEADRVLEVMAENGLERGRDGLEVYVMAEIPANILLADEFAERFDGFSIGTNDLTQLVLGVDRDSAELRHLFDERNEAVKWSIRHLIERAHARGRKVGICGQAPSDHPDFAEFLVEAGIDSISLNPDRVLDVLRRVAELERRGR